MKKKIKEVIVVEGKDDISAVKNAVDAEVFQVNGHAVRKNKSIEILTNRMDELNLDKESYEFYLDLRRYGSFPHSGYGLGFERMMMYITGMQNIRDVLPFPRTPNNAEF